MTDNSPAQAVSRTIDWSAVVVCLYLVSLLAGWIATRLLATTGPLSVVVTAMSLGVALCVARRAPAPVGGVSICFALGALTPWVVTGLELLSTVAM